MNKRDAVLGWAVLIIITTVISFSSVTALSPQPHDQNCAGCHLAGDRTLATNAQKLLGTQEKLCGQCHADALRLSHATGFTPIRDLPDEYPLDWKGDVTCSTCHDIHSAKKGLIRGDKYGRELCLSCHEAAFFSAMPDAGISIMRAGHIDARVNREKLMLDTFSIKCLECHGGKADGGPIVTVDARSIVRHAEGSVNHPVGRDYESASRYGGYRSRKFLSKAIFLPDGQVGCVSCHKGYTSKHGELTKSNQGSSLCFECHDL